MGIATVDGTIYDFAGPYTIGSHQLAFGAPTRYIQLPLSSLTVGRQLTCSLDEAIAIGNTEYSGRMHNLICDNCHSHVAYILNQMKYKGFSNWNMVILAFWMFFFGKYTGWSGFFKTWIPFIIVFTIFIAIAQI